MSLPRFVLPWSGEPSENARIELSPEHVRHASVLRLRPGSALEVLLPTGPWKADLAELHKGRGCIRLVAPLGEDREAPIPLHACLPITAQLSLWDDWIPGVVELGASLLQPVVYGRSEANLRKVADRMERWQRILVGACEQSHRSRIPELRSPVPFEALLSWPTPQRWVAYEVATGQPNPILRREALAFTHGPEGGLTDGEFQALREAGWSPVTLGRSILRAVTCPSALLGAIQYALGTTP